MVTVKAGGALLAIEAAKNFRAVIGDPADAPIPVPACHLFHSETRERLS